MRGSDYISIVQTRSDGLLAYAKYLGPRKQINRTTWREGVMIQKYTGKMSGLARKNIMKAVDLLLQISPEIMLYNPVSKSYHQFKINFITLTISTHEIITHPEAYKNCLKPFLRYLRTKGATAYIWKAELQRRGQIHYHITTNKFIHYKDINSVWNKYQKKAGYLDTYGKANGHFNPNSTDVHSVTKIKNIKAYLGKYLSKEISKTESDGRIKGRCWDCSNNLKVKYFEMEATDEMDRSMELYITKLAEVIGGNYFSYYKKLKPGHAGQSYNNYYVKFRESIIGT